MISSFTNHDMFAYPYMPSVGAVPMDAENVFINPYYRHFLLDALAWAVQAREGSGDKKESIETLIGAFGLTGQEEDATLNERLMSSFIEPMVEKVKAKAIPSGAT